MVCKVVGELIMSVNFSVENKNSVELRKRKDQLQFPVLLVMTFILMLLIFLVDRITNPEVAVGVGYISAVLFSWMFAKNIHSIVVAIFCSFFVLLDYSYSVAEHPDLYILIPNVALSIGSIIITLILVILARSQSVNIRQINNTLEDTVKKRTLELETRVEEIKAKNRIINETQLDLLNAAKLAKESELKFKNLFEGVPDAVMLVDDDGVIENVNNKTKDIFGYTVQEITNTKIKQLIPSYKKVAKTSKEDKLTYTFETICRKKDTTIFEAEISLKRLIVGGKEVNSLSIRDISERKETEQLLRMHTKTLEAKNKELEQFVYIASHDLQEPLRTVSGFVQILKTDYADKYDDDAKEMFSHINGSADRMTNLLTGLLEYGRLGRKAEKVNIDCNKLITEVTKDIELTMQETNTILQVENLPTVKGFEAELRVLFQNLITNAIKFKKPGLAPVIHIGAQRLEDKWQFYVRDNGIGIEKKFEKKIFTIFQRLHHREAYKGYGVGLAQVKKIVELHNGEVTVFSEPNVGTTFFFTINDIIL